jgi:hypothetical protein
LTVGVFKARAVEEPRYNVRVADHEYWREQIKCQYACPVHTDARGYVRAIAAGAYEHAYLIARGPNPLASLCGRICGAPCEAACRRGTIDQPISIRALKPFVCEKFGSDARRDAGRELFPYLKSQNQTRQCDDVEELSHLIEFLANAEFPKPTGERIAIVGSGPAGLAAGHDLALMGFRPTILEMEQQPAGMLYTGVPGYRLPRELIRAEVAVIQSLGVEGLAEDMISVKMLSSGGFHALCSFSQFCPLPVDHSCSCPSIRRRPGMPGLPQH